jgi:hypothetical protein
MEVVMKEKENLLLKVKIGSVIYYKENGTESRIDIQSEQEMNYLKKCVISKRVILLDVIND